MTHYTAFISEEVEVEVISYKELEAQIEEYFDEAHDEFETWCEFVEFVIGDIVTDLGYENTDLELCEVEQEMLHDWK